MDYQEFLANKIGRDIISGFDVPRLSDFLFPFQSFIVKKALKIGRYALFEDCGLGKTVQQLVWSDEVSKHTNKPVLILAPLAVSAQTIEEGNKFGIEVKKALTDNSARIQIANYEQLDNIDCSIYSGVVLDESSILKNYEGSIRNTVITEFKYTPYKLACTATPSPNDPMELGNHSEFLGVMSRSEMLAMYFVHDGSETAKWRLKGHSVGSFWAWVSTWASMLSKPSDIGFHQDGYDLPKLNYIEKKIETAKRDNGMLFNTVAISATNFNAELRITKIDRIDHAASIVTSSDETFIVWIKQNEEGEYFRKAVPESVEVKGSDTNEYKETTLLGFAHGKHRVLITKPKIAQFGMNFQNCHNQIFASLDFSFEGLYQSIRRSYRFGQKHQVNIYIITTDTMTNVINVIKRKQSDFEKMQAAMSGAINKDLHVGKKSSNLAVQINIPKWIQESTKLETS